MSREWAVGENGEESFDSATDGGGGFEGAAVRCNDEGEEGVEDIGGVGRADQQPGGRGWKVAREFGGELKMEVGVFGGAMSIPGVAFAHAGAGEQDGTGRGRNILAVDVPDGISPNDPDEFIVEGVAFGEGCAGGVGGDGTFDIREGDHGYTSE